MRTNSLATVMIKRLLVMSVLVIWCGQVLSANPTNQQSSIEELSYWIDSTGEATVFDAQNATQAFQRNNSSEIDLGVVRGAVWLKVPIAIESSSTEQQFLVLNKVHIQKVDFYQFIEESTQDRKLLKHTSTGTDRPFDSRELDIPIWAFNIRQQKGQHQLLLRLETRSPMQTKVAIEPTVELIAHSHQYTLGYAIILGFLAFTCVIALIIARTIKQRSMWLGCLLMGSVLLEILSSSGLGFEHIWPDYPAINPIMNRISISFALGAIGLFCVEFLQARLFAPRLARATQVSCLVLMSSMLLPMPAISPLLTSFIFFLVPGLTFSITTLAYQHNIAGARLIMLGVGTFLACVLASVMTAHRVLPVSLDYENIYDAGLLCTTLLLTYGLANRISENALESAVNKESIKAKTLFFATVSHEIRTPINGIIGMLNLMLKDNLNDPQKRLALYAQSSAESLLHLINDILDFSKIEAGKLDIEPIDFDVASLMEELVDSLACIDPHKSLEIVLDTSQMRDSYIKSDPGRLRQILNNIIGNALKFTETGEVEIRANLIEENANTILKVSIRDSGIGISPEQIAGLFRTFTQADQSTTRKYGGTGLGLSIAKQLCELMGGDISATSKPGIGSTFTFTTRVEKVTRKFGSQQPDLNEMLAVIYAPNSRVKLAAKAYLERWGAKAIAAGTVQEFYELVLEKHPQVVFYDGILDNLGYQPLHLIATQDSTAPDLKLVTKPITADKLKWSFLTQTSNPDISVDEDKFTNRNSKLLLVEDNFINTEVALGILEDFGYLNVVHAENGKEALNILREGDFDLVLMDCQMPILDGYATTQNIRAGEGGTKTNIPVIAMTANAMQGDREKCLAVGMNDYLTKPIDPNKLSNTLSNWLA